MGLKTTQTKLGKEEGMSYNGTGPHAWFKEPVRNTERGRERKTEWKKMDLLGSIDVAAVGGETGIRARQKATEFFSAIHLKTNCTAQAAAAKPHLTVEWILFWVLTRAHRCFMCGPCAKSQSEEKQYSLEGGNVGGKWRKQAEVKKTGGKGSESDALFMMLP